jgi:hypothetical protein
VSRTPLPYEPPLAAALRACADGLYPAEARDRAPHQSRIRLCRDDFRDGYAGIGTSITDGIATMAAVDWLAASLADGITIDLRDAFTGTLDPEPTG